MLRYYSFNIHFKTKLTCQQKELKPAPAVQRYKPNEWAGFFGTIYIHTHGDSDEEDDDDDDSWWSDDDDYFRSRLE